jgi:hypothetical protein
MYEILPNMGKEDEEDQMQKFYKEMKKNEKLVDGPSERIMNLQD